MPLRRLSRIFFAAATIALPALPATALNSHLAVQAEEDDTLFWHDNYQAALLEARETGKPIFLEFRCAP